MQNKVDGHEIAVRSGASAPIGVLPDHDDPTYVSSNGLPRFSTWSQSSPTATQNVVLAQETALRRWLVWWTLPPGQVAMAPGVPLPVPSPTAVQALGVEHDTEDKRETPPPSGGSQIPDPVPVRKPTFPS
jgi:hypothetical protein